MLETSIFSFSRNVFYPSQKECPYFLITFIVLSANAFNLNQSKKLLFGKELINRSQALTTMRLHFETSVKGGENGSNRKLYRISYWALSK